MSQPHVCEAGKRPADDHQVGVGTRAADAFGLPRAAQRRRRVVVDVERHLCLPYGEPARLGHVDPFTQQVGGPGEPAPTDGHPLPEQHRVIAE